MKNAMFCNGRAELNATQAANSAERTESEDKVLEFLITTHSYRFISQTSAPTDPD